MQRGPALSPDAPEAETLLEVEHGGMVLREVVRDSLGKVVSQSVKRVPIERDLQAAMTWAAKKFGHS